MMDESTCALIGKRIRRERTIRNLTQEECAHLLRVSTNYLGQIERGTRQFSLSLENRVCELFGLSHEDLCRPRKETRDTPFDIVAESGAIFHDLTEAEIMRMMKSCSPEEFQLCGHLIRSTLHYLRNSRPRRLIVADVEHPDEYILKPVRVRHYRKRRKGKTDDKPTEENE
ncbi:MAG: helix-turn-helix transcriptional regulator [Lachnospiraceae bacterium]|nr:helix-turn-helix transcriptional regulator [Lachnospiraceae bacterium]